MKKNRVDTALNLRISSETMRKLKALATKKGLVVIGGGIGHCTLARELILEALEREFGGKVAV